MIGVSVDKAIISHLQVLLTYVNPVHKPFRAVFAAVPTQFVLNV